MIIKIEDHNNFVNFLEKNISREDFRFKYLIKILDAIYSQNIEANCNSFVLEEKDTWILFIETSNQIFLYGDHYLDEHISQFVSIINLNEYKNYDIMGTFDLVYLILSLSYIENYKIIKDRLFYCLSNYEPTDSKLDIKLANENDVEELATMFQDYYSEEYEGTRNKSRDFLIPQISSLINNKSIYVFKTNDTIASFCTIQDPDIGILFTKNQFRNNGIGHSLLEYCTKILYNKNKIVYLLTDMHNGASNCVCQKIGFEILYQHTNVLLQP